jgi:hypothetical protein
MCDLIPFPRRFICPERRAQMAEEARQMAVLWEAIQEQDDWLSLPPYRTVGGVHIDQRERMPCARIARRLAGRTRAGQHANARRISPGRSG